MSEVLGEQEREKKKDEQLKSVSFSLSTSSNLVLSLYLSHFPFCLRPSP